MKLSHRATKLLDAFDEAAQRYAYERDQGTSSATVDAAQTDYEKTKDVLERHIARLEQKLAKLQEPK